MTRVPLRMVRNDTKPDLVFTILYAAGPNKGSAFDLNGCTINFHLRKRGTTTIKNTGHTLCTITDAENGLGKYTWDSSDMDAAGRYTGELEIEFADTTVQTIFDEAEFIVRADYDNA